MHPYGCEVSAMWPICAPISAARGGAGDKFGEIQPPCMTPLVYAAGSREHRNYLLIDYPFESHADGKAFRLYGAEHIVGHAGYVPGPRQGICSRVTGYPPSPVTGVAVTAV